MATYTSSPKIRKAYAKCEGYYVGFGPVLGRPTRFRISVFWPTAQPQLMVMLAVVTRRRDPYRLKVWHRPYRARRLME